MAINPQTIRILTADNIAALSCSANAVCNSFNELACSIAALEANLYEFESKNRTVLDEKSEKPEQKWLWEIFEPNVWEEEDFLKFSDSNMFLN